LVLLPGRGVQFGGYSQRDVAHSGFAADSVEREEDNAQYKIKLKLLDDGEEHASAAKLHPEEFSADGD